MSNIRIAHLRRDPKNQYTVAYQLHDDNKIVATVAIGIAKCNRKDQFNKKMGKAIATGRLAKAANIVHIPTIGSDRYKDIQDWIGRHTKELLGAEYTLR